MTTRIGFVLLGVLALGACGDGGDGDANISGVVPGDVFAGRRANVLISGSDTDWSDGVAVDFGAGITVGDVVVASPNALWVPIEVAPDAELGPRDVTVDGDLSYEGAFSVTSPLAVTSVEGTMAQGSVMFVTIQNLDFTSPFDTTSTGDGFFEPLVYTNIAFETAAGVTVSPSGVEPYTLSARVLLDVGAPAGPLDLTVKSGPADGVQTTSTFGGAFDIGAREAIALDGGAAVAGTIANPFDSVLYRLSVSDKAVINASVLSDNPDANTSLVVLGDSGSFDDYLGQDDDFTALTATSVYVLVWDNGGAGGIDYDVSAIAAVVGATTDDETASANDTTGQAQVVVAPVTVNTCELDGDTDVDWFEVEIPAGGDRAIGAATQGAPDTDTVLQIFAADGTTSVAGPSDQSFHEALVSELLAPGTYYVRVSNTGDPYVPSPGTYTLSIGLSEVDSNE